MNFFQVLYSEIFQILVNFKKDLTFFPVLGTEDKVSFLALRFLFISVVKHGCNFDCIIRHKIALGLTIICFLFRFSFYKRKTQQWMNWIRFRNNGHTRTSFFSVIEEGQNSKSLTDGACGANKTGLDINHVKIESYLTLNAQDNPILMTKNKHISFFSLPLRALRY